MFFFFARVIYLSHEQKKNISNNKPNHLPEAFFINNISLGIIILF